MLTFSHVNFCPLRTTLCFLSLKKSCKRSSRLPDIPFCDNLNFVPSCYTLSEALEISRKAILTSSPSRNDLKISNVMDES